MTSGQEVPERKEWPDLRLVPVAVGAWAATWAGTAGSTRTVVAAVAMSAAVGLAAAMLRSLRWAAVLLAMLTGLGVGVLHESRISQGPVFNLAAEGAIVTVTLTTRTDPQVQPAAGVRPAYLLLRARVTAVSGRGASWRVRAPVLVTVSGDLVPAWSQLPVGSSLRVQARLQSPQPGSDISAVVRVRGPAGSVTPPSPALRQVERVREGLRQAVAERRAEQRALVPALVLGDTSAVTPAITEDFQATGLTHLTAVSGANLTLLLAFMLIMARWAGVRGRWLRLVGLVGVAVFVALCRTEPSVLRAAAMGLVALAALGAGGRGKGLRNLAVAMLVLLLLDPFLSRSIGFALSVLASGGIIWWGGRWAAVLHRWMPKVVAESVAVPLAAHLATLPVVAAISGRVSAVGVLTNAVAGPFVGPATVFGFAAAGLSLLSGTAAAVVGFGAAWSAQMILWVAHLGARLPGASRTWPVNPMGIVVLTMLAVTTAWLTPRVLRYRALTLLVVLIMIVICIRPPGQPGWPARDWVLVACDVGQGDGLVLRVAMHQAVVVDTGPEPALIDDCLDQLHIATVPLLVLTHSHADHVDGISGVLEGRVVGAVWESPLAATLPEGARVRELAEARGIPVHVPAPGMEVTIGESRLRVLGPAGSAAPVLLTSAEGESSAENDASLVLVASVRGLRILLTGDVEPTGQQAILATGADLRSDVLKLPHHGSSRQDPAFIAATGARVAIASAGVDNSYGHPAPRTLRLVTSLGMTVLRTDLHGSVAITAKAGQVAAVAQR